jgi:hypothetical protein
MDPKDYTTEKVIDFAPRARASQEVAAAKRARPTHDTEPIQPLVSRSNRHTVPLGVGALVLIALMIGMSTWQLSRTPAKPLQLQPTDAPAKSLVAPPTRAPAPTSEATATAAPTSTPAPTQAPPMGQGLTVDQAEATPTDLPAPTVEPSYIEFVGQQAPHCIRSCDGQPGPNGGDWVAVPTVAPAMLEVIGQQAPHKVR